MYTYYKNVLSPGFIDPYFRYIQYSRGAAEWGSDQTGVGGGNFGALLKSHFDDLVLALWTSPLNKMIFYARHSSPI